MNITLKRHLFLPVNKNIQCPIMYIMLTYVNPRTNPEESADKRPILLAVLISSSMSGSFSRNILRLEN